MLSCKILDLGGIGRHSLILQAAPDHDSPEKGLSAPESPSYIGDYKLILSHFTAVTSKQSQKLARNMIAYSYLCCGKGRQC